MDGYSWSVILFHRLYPFSAVANGSFCYHGAKALMKYELQRCFEISVLY